MIVCECFEYNGYKYKIHKYQGYHQISPYSGQHPIASQSLDKALEAYFQSIHYGYR